MSTNVHVLSSMLTVILGLDQGWLRINWLENEWIILLDEKMFAPSVSKCDVILMT